MKPRDLHSLLDMIQSAEIVTTYISDLSESEFASNEEKQDAVIRRLLVIGEAANRVSEEGQAEIPELEWPKIRGMRNRLAHEYDNISLKVVWQIAQTEMTALISKIKPVVPPDDQLSIL